MRHRRTAGMVGGRVDRLRGRCGSSASGVVGVAEVGLLHRGVVADLGRGAGGDDLAEVEDVDLVADRHDQVHVVLDHEDAAALGRPARAAARRTPRSRTRPGPTTARRGAAAAGRRPGSGPARAAGRPRSGSSRPARRRTPRCRPARAARPRRPPRAGGPARAGRAWMSWATRTLSRTVSEPNASSRWKVRPIPRLARRCTGVWETLRPLNRTLPRVGFCSPLITLKQVVLPAPFGPISPVTRPDSATNDAWLTAVTPPNWTTTSSTTRSGSVRMGGHPLWLVDASRSASSGSPRDRRAGVGRLARIDGAIRRSSQRPSVNSWLARPLGSLASRIAPTARTTKSSPATEGWSLWSTGQRHQRDAAQHGAGDRGDARRPRRRGAAAGC